jgi:hypothetical protein
MQKLLIVFTALLFAVNAYALDPAQRATVKTALLADQAFAAALAVGDTQTVADLASAPVVEKCWDEDFERAELLDALNFTAYIARSVAEKSALELMFTTGTVDTRRTNIRQAFADIFSGTAAAAANQRAALTAAAQRSCLWIEKVLAPSQTGGAYITTYTGGIGWQDVVQILGD